MEKIKFDYEKYLTGDYDVVTRGGMEVKIAGHNPHANTFAKITGWVDNTPESWGENGYYVEAEHNLDLFLIPKKRIVKGWANVYTYDIIGGVLYPTKEDAQKGAISGCIGLIYIESELE